MSLTTPTLLPALGICLEEYSTPIRFTSFPSLLISTTQDGIRGCRT